ncbi:MAG TPA: hypothetical protein VGD60_12870 [Candidatus Acidoferrales bacterium]
MLTGLDDLLVIAACMTGALLFLFVLKHFWPIPQRRDHNDIIGWQVSVLGTTYAVIIGFMLYAVWTSFEAAELNADGEANCLVSVFRLAGGLPTAERGTVRTLARQYADSVIDVEWPAMNRAQSDSSSQDITQKLWAAVMEVKPQTFAEQTSMQQALTEISSMTEHRRIRQLQNNSKLPGVLWLVLVMGGGITIMSSCLFGTENFRLHCVQVISLTLLLSLALVAIGDIDRPFQGAVRVTPAGFERARGTFAQFPAETP